MAKIDCSAEESSILLSALAVQIDVLKRAQKAAPDDELRSYYAGRIAKVEAVKLKFAPGLI